MDYSTHWPQNLKGDVKQNNKDSGKAVLLLMFNHIGKGLDGKKLSD